MSRNEIMTIIKNSNKVSVRTLNDVLEHCVCTIGVTKGNQFTGSIDMYRARNCQFLFATSLGVGSMLTQKDVQKDKITETRTDELLLYEIRPDIANTLQDDILSEFVHTRLSVTPQFVEDLPVDITIALESLYTDDGDEIIGFEKESVPMFNHLNTFEQDIIYDKSEENISDVAASSNDQMDLSLNEIAENVSYIKHTDMADPIKWYSMPEYVPDKFTYQFSFLDCHHLFVNARVKCCSSGIIERGIKKEAWLKVAKNSASSTSRSFRL